MFSFPWSNFHELNLDWILSVVKEAKDIFVRGNGDIQHAVETADQALETAEQAAAGVIADGAVTIAKVNDEVFNLMAFIVSGSVTPVAIPAGSLVILRKSTVYNVNDGIYVAASDIAASSILTAADLLQPSPLPDAGGLNYVLEQIGDTDVAVDAIQRGLVTVVDGDTATSTVPVGALAYLKNNTHNLQEGIYANISNVPFPTTGGTADSTIFSAVPNVLNTIKDITGDGALTDFTATDLTEAANELKSAITQLGNDFDALRDYIDTAFSGKNVAVVAGVARYVNGEWILLNNSGHNPLNLVIESGQTDPKTFTVKHEVGATKVLSLICAPDDGYSKQGCICGASVGLNESVVEVSFPCVAASAITNTSGSSTYTHTLAVYKDIVSSIQEVAHATLGTFLRVELSETNDGIFTIQSANAYDWHVLGFSNTYINLQPYLNGQVRALPLSAGNVNFSIQKQTHGVTGNIIHTNCNIWIFGIFEV